MMAPTPRRLGRTRPPTADPLSHAELRSTREASRDACPRTRLAHTVRLAANAQPEASRSAGQAWASNGASRAGRHGQADGRVDDYSIRVGVSPRGEIWPGQPWTHARVRPG